MSKILSIGFLLDDTLDTADGVQQYVTGLGGWFSKNGHEVHYLVGETTRKDINNIHSMAKNVKVRFNKNRLSIPLPASGTRIKKKLAELNLDVLHVQMPYSPLFAGKVIDSVSEKTKVIGTFHIVPASKMHYLSSKGLSYLNAKTSKKFNKIICVSSAAADFAKSAFGYETVVIPNVVDIDKFHHPPVNHKTPTIVFLGRLVERKGCKQLLDALLVLQNNYHEPYKVIIAGKGPLKTELEMYAIKNKVKNVQFVGFVSEAEKSKLLAGADIAVFPSTGGESFGIVLIEAMAAGSRVVLGGNNEGYRTVLEDYPDLLIDPNVPTSFADRLQYYLEHPQSRLQAYNWAQSQLPNYDINHVGTKILEIYKN
ncbi:glycosyltransferase family 4 protein [Candidatus Nomurabacteria bacterium]|jgi:phosphatidylinositol alpha-mannosyltransferase|nr:glycosyltransferase family 4 protein [Candidatus Saccharibacteria bacterium]MCB9839757.1 glycosyltransferase family 4 protein [Candidatus Nomurabacteria bacterium]